jgi:hypothetical protein
LWRRRLPDVRAYLSPVASHFTPQLLGCGVFYLLCYCMAARLFNQAYCPADAPFVGANLFQAQILARHQLATQRLGEFPGVALEAGSPVAGSKIGSISPIELPVVFLGAFRHA